MCDNGTCKCGENDECSGEQYCDRGQCKGTSWSISKSTKILLTLSCEYNFELSSRKGISNLGEWHCFKETTHPPPSKEFKEKNCLSSLEGCKTCIAGATTPLGLPYIGLSWERNKDCRGIPKKLTRNSRKPDPKNTLCFLSGKFQYIFR